MNILFMGTPDFATTCLDALIADGMQVAAVVTQPDKKQGRGMKVAYSDVKKYALAHEIPVHQPETLKDGALLPLLDAVKPDVIAVVAYGKLLPAYVLDYPRYGCINVHGSLLPAYRGAAPIQRAVLAGDAYSGVTTMYMAAGMDTGDMLLREKVAIGENMTTGELFDTLAALGGKLLVQTLHGLENGTLSPIPQQHENATYAAKITNEECLVDFHDDVRAVHNKIRGLSPFPGAYCYLNGKVVKLYDSTVVSEKAENTLPGKVVSLSGTDGVHIACGSGTLCLRRFKPEGKGILTAADMINGRKITPDSIFSTIKE